MTDCTLFSSTSSVADGWRRFNSPPPPPIKKKYSQKGEKEDQMSVGKIGRQGNVLIVRK
jgi:hypothetical protein